MARRPDAAGVTVPATPAWTVHDVLSHLTGLLADIEALNLDGQGTDAWTAAQVDPRRALSLDEVLTEWEQRSVGAETLLEDLDQANADAIIGDIAVHEIDVAYAVGLPPPWPTPSTDTALRHYVRLLGERLTESAKPPLRLQGETTSWTAGDGDATNSVRADDFTLLRALSGRRTITQLRALDWDGDAESYLGVLSGYGLPDQPIES